MNTLLDLAGPWLHEVIALSWKGAWLALLAGLLLVLLRRRLSPAWRHGLWMLVLLRLALPDVATSPVSVARWLPMPAPESAAVVMTIPPAAMPVLPRPLLEETVPDLPMIEETPAPVGAAVMPPATKAAWTTWDWLTLLWLAGTGGMIATMLALHLRLLARVRRDPTAPAAGLAALYASACERAGIKRGAPRLIITNAVRAPALFGVLRPVILLPRELAASGDPEALRLILLHELAHWQRRDLWTQLAASLLLALHWFNPAVWWAARRLRAEAEMAADARALRHAEAGAAHRLGEVLLGFTQHATAGWMTWLAAATVLGISENQRDLRHRIEALVDLARGRRTWWLPGLVMFAALTVTGFTQAPVEPDQTKTEATESAAAAAVITVTGIAVDTKGQPVAGADCNLSWGDPVQKKTVSSDSVGRFQFEEVPTGMDARLWANHPDHLSTSGIILTLSAGIQDEQRLVLTPCNAWLTGKVTRKDTGAPVAGARILAGHDSSSASDAGKALALGMLAHSPRRSVITDDNGVYRVPNWTEHDAQIMILIDAPGMKLETAGAVWKKGANLDLAHELEPGVEITGSVVDADGKPVSDATVELASRLYMLGSSDMAGVGENRRPSLYTRWIGPKTADAEGRFSGKPLDDTPAEKLFLTAHHPDAGWGQVRLADWQPGGKLTLTPWSAMHGRLLDADEKPIAFAHLKFSQSIRARDNSSLHFLFSYQAECQTDEQGNYRFERLIPGASGGGIRQDETYLGTFNGPFHSGESMEVTLRPPPAKAAPSAQARVVRGRILVPEGFQVRSNRYQIRANFTRAGNVGAYSVDELGDAGRFETRPLEPGDYTLRVWVQSKEAEWTSPSNSGLTLPFRLEEEARSQPLDLGELKLEAGDFKFRSSRAKSSASSTTERKVQKIDLSVSGGASFATWAGSLGNGVSKETPFSTDGRITGAAVLSSSGHFLLRATARDGSRHYSSLQTGSEELNQALRHETTFNPGVAVEGRLRNLPQNHTGGWVAAAVKITAQARQGELLRGGLPYLTWYAWAPVTTGGRFRFDSLPRGSLTLVGFGEGWATRHSHGLGLDVKANLIEAGDTLNLDADTVRASSKRLRVLQADGQPAPGAVVTVTSISNTILNRAWQKAGHAVEPAAAAAYEQFKSQDIPGHRAVADSAGHATLRNQLFQSYGSTTCTVTWSDPVSGVKKTQRTPLLLESNDIQVVRLESATE